MMGIDFLKEKWQQDVLDKYCNRQADIYEMLVRACGKALTVSYAELYKRFEKLKEERVAAYDYWIDSRDKKDDSLNEEFNQAYQKLLQASNKAGSARDALQISGNKLKLIGLWLTTAVYENHYWLHNTNDEGQPKKLCKNLDKALRDAQKWLLREHSLGQQIPPEIDQLAEKIFGAAIGRKEKLAKAYFGTNTKINLECDDDDRKLFEEYTPYTPEEFAGQHVSGLNGTFTIKVRATMPSDEEKASPWFPGSSEAGASGGKGYNLPKLSINIDGGEFGLICNRSYNLNNSEVSAAGAGVVARGRNVFKTFFRNHIDICEHLGMKKICISAGDIGAYAWLRYGYVPHQDSWGCLKENVQTTLDQYRDKLSDNTIRQIEAALQSENPKAAWLIADQREKIDGKPIGFHLMYKNSWSGELDLTDEESMARIKCYIAQDNNYQAPKQEETIKDIPRPLPA